MTSFGVAVDQVPNQRLGFPLYGPPPSPSCVILLKVVHSTFDPLVESSFSVVLAT